MIIDGHSAMTVQRRSGIKLAAFSAGLNVPSARFRVRQYISELRPHGIFIDEFFPLSGSAYPPPGALRRISWLGSQVAQRMGQLRRARRHDLVVLQRQMVSTVNTLECLTKRPRLFDVDDAVWLSARFKSVDRLVRRCDGVVCGNDWLADYFSQHNSNVHIVPTAVDSRLWTPRASADTSPRRYLGWIGTHGNLKYLSGIEGALRRVLKIFKDIDVLVVSDKAPLFSSLPISRVVYRPWDITREIEDIQSMSVGLMPLDDNEWTRGKCSFKMLQYSSCGVPSVVSPVGMNLQVAALGGGLPASSESEWVDAMVALLKDDVFRQQAGEKARATIEAHYSTQVVAERLAGIIRHYV